MAITQQALATRDKEVAALTDQRQTLGRRIADQKAQIDALIDTRRVLQTQILGLQEEAVNHLTRLAHLDTATGTVTRLRRELVATEMQVEAVRKEKRALDGLLAKSKVERQSLADMLAAERRAVATNEAQIDALQKQIGVLAKRNKSLDQRIEEQQSQLVDAEQEQEQIRTQLTKTREN